MLIMRWGHACTVWEGVARVTLKAKHARGRLEHGGIEVRNAFKTRYLGGVAVFFLYRSPWLVSTSFN